MEQRSISIYDEVFPVTAPYAAGHVITEAEARSLNQTRAENIGNNFRKRVKEVKESGGDMEALKAEFAKYDSEYVFTVSGGGGTRVVRDPVEAEARKIARSKITAKLIADGRKVKDIDKEKLEAAITQLAGREDIMKQAQKIVKERNKILDEDLDLGL